jgi:hypothetical protein
MVSIALGDPKNDAHSRLARPPQPSLRGSSARYVFSDRLDGLATAIFAPLPLLRSAPHVLVRDVAGTGALGENHEFCTPFAEVFGPLQGLLMKRAFLTKKAIRIHLNQPQYRKKRGPFF